MGGPRDPPATVDAPGDRAPLDSFSWIDFKDGTGSFDVDSSGNSWKFLLSKKKDGVEVFMYSRPASEKAGLCEFLVRGQLPISRDSYFVLNADMEYRPTWDTTTTAIAELSSWGPGPEAGEHAHRQRLLHWCVTYPWPLGKRDYVLQQGVHAEVDARTGGVVRCIQGKTLPVKESITLRPLGGGVARVEDYRSNMAIWAGGNEQEAKFALLYFEDSKVSLPTWMVSKVAASTLPGQLAGAVPIAENYPQDRVTATLGRYGALPIPEAARDEENAEEAFFSASEDEETGKIPRTPRRFRKTISNKSLGVMPATQATAVTPVAATPRVSPVAAAAPRARVAAGAAPPSANTPPEKDVTPHFSKLRQKLTKVGKKVIGDIEEGMAEEPLFLSSEEKDLLLEILSETRERKRHGSWWWPCSCRRRLCGGHRSRHKV